MNRDAGCTAGPCMYRDRYFEIERLLDEVLGTEDGDGAGDGIVADVHLALARAQQRGAVKALAQIEALYGDERAGELTVRGNVQMAAHDLARRIESGEVTL